MKRQKIIWRSPSISLLILIASMLGLWCRADAHMSQFGIPVAPLHIQLTGILYAPDAVPEKPGGFRTVQLLMSEKKKLVFVIDKARNLSTAETMTSILERIFPPQVYVFGDEKAIEFLKNSDIIGKPVTLEGYLYQGSRVFHVSQVGTPPAEESKSRSTEQRQSLANVRQNPATTEYFRLIYYYLLP